VTGRSIDLSAFRIAPAPRLIGGRHRASGQVSFPSPRDAEAFEPVELPAAGTLWSFTVQRHAPKAPYRGSTPFVPFAIGYVELPSALIVESPLVGIEFDALRIGLPVELTSFPLYHDEDGTDVLMFAFTVRRRASA
jgi:uncharacterized OB-fold protein